MSDRINEQSSWEKENEGSNKFDEDDNGNKDNGDDKSKNLLGKIVNFFTIDDNDYKQENDQLDKTDKNNNWPDKNVDHEDQTTLRSLGKDAVSFGKDAVSFGKDAVKKTMDGAANVVKKWPLVDARSHLQNDSNENEDLPKNIPSKDRNDATWRNEDWTQRYVDYDKQDVTPRDISNDYIKDEMVGNVRGVYLKTRNLENDDQNVDQNVAGFVDRNNKNDNDQRENINA